MAKSVSTIVLLMLVFFLSHMNAQDYEDEVFKKILDEYMLELQNLADPMETKRLLETIIQNITGDTNSTGGEVTSPPLTTTTEPPPTIATAAPSYYRFLNRLLAKKPKKCVKPWLAYEKALRQGKVIKCSRTTTPCPPLFYENQGRYGDPYEYM